MLFDKRYLLFYVLFNIHYQISSSCIPQGVENKVTISSSTWVCLMIAPLNWTEGNGSYNQITSKATADSMSRITVKNSWGSSNYSEDDMLSNFNIKPQKGSGLSVSVASMGILSFQKLYRFHDGQKGFTFPMLMAIITVEKGKVERIDWDENCYWCGGTTSDQCSKNVYDYDGNHAPKIGEGSCFVEDSLHYCSPSSSSTSGINGTLYTSELCQLSVYIVWTGTDSKGNFFSSSSSRFSRFSEFQINRFAISKRDEVVQITGSS